MRRIRGCFFHLKFKSNFTYSRPKEKNASKLAGVLLLEFNVARIVPLALVAGAASLTGGSLAFSADVQQADIYAAETVPPVRKHF